jgi:hypothetical protein
MVVEKVPAKNVTALSAAQSGDGDRAAAEGRNPRIAERFHSDTRLDKGFRNRTWRVATRPSGLVGLVWVAGAIAVAACIMVAATYLVGPPDSGGRSSEVKMSRQRDR